MTTPVDAAAVLRTSIISLSHPLSRVVRLPELLQKVREGNLGRIVHHLRSQGAWERTW